MDCCCQKISSEENAHPFHSLHQNDHLTISAPTKSNKSMPIPKLKVSLDLPGFTDYLPTYWPGQKITGEIEIEPLSTIKVSSLRIILFGQAQVHGEQPGKPLTNGMFDYSKNVQIINKGLQVTRRSLPLSTPPNEEEEGDANSSGGTAVDPCWRIYCKNSNNGVSDNSNDCNSTNNNSSNNNNVCPTVESKKRLKTAEDRHIEKLVKEITTFCDSTGIRIDSPHHNKESKIEFELNESKHRIRFSMDASGKLPSSFEHPHFPISYSIVVLMTCRTPENACFTLYATEKLRLERFLNIDISQHTDSIQTPCAYRYIPKSNSIMSNVFSSSLHLIKISIPTSKMKLKSQNISLEQNKHLSDHDSFLNVYLQSPRQAYEPSQQVPLQLKLLNNTTSFRICTIKTEIRLVRRINMHCNLGEEVEAIDLDSAQLVLQNTPQQLNLNFSKLTFDLSEICKIPEDASNSISNKATKEVFSMSYNYHVTMYVTGEIADGVTLDSQEKTFFIQQRDVQRLSSLRKLNCCSENHDHKTYMFELEPLVITVGRFAHGTI